MGWNIIDMWYILTKPTQNMPEVDMLLLSEIFQMKMTFRWNNLFAFKIGYLGLISTVYLLQPPKYLIIIVNRITYSNNRITKNKGRMPLDLYIKLGPYKFSIQASVDHHGYSMNSGHYTASINYCGKTFHCNDNKIIVYNITDTYNSSTAYILLYKLLEC